MEKLREKIFEIDTLMTRAYLWKASQLYLNYLKKTNGGFINGQTLFANVMPQ